MEHTPRDHEGTPGAPLASPTNSPGVRLDRRKLLRAGAGATPVLLSLASSPVSATQSCVVASSFVSVATFKSRNPSLTQIKCTTRTCEDWRGACSPPWPSTRPACLEPTVSTCLGSSGSGYNTHKLYQVLQAGTGIATTGELGVLQHIITMCLCVTQGWHTGQGGMSQSYLSGIWQNYKANGDQYVLPASGITWDSTKLISWLRYQIYGTAL